MSQYKIKELYYTIQGEGAQTGRPAVFCRFSGCNLWSGREEDRANAICSFCDTDFWGMDGENGGSYSAEELAEKCKSLWPDELENALVVCTGGEPLLQMDDDIVSAFHEIGFEIAIETNGTLKAPANIDWICVSPKANTEIIQDFGNELKLVYPQAENLPKDYAHMDFDHFYLQPLYGPDTSLNTEKCIQFCKQNPKWKLSIQTHKYVGMK